MTQPESGEFIQLLTVNQSRLYAYILTLCGDPVQADDIMQETNAVLWQKAAEYQAGSNFTAWMFKTAYFQVLAYRQKQHREKVRFDSELVTELSNETAGGLDQIEARQRALHQCLEKLPARQREMVRQRYAGGAALDQIAAELGQTAEAVKQALFRARLTLLECVKRQLANE